MYEELYEPLPDRDAYLERIGIERASKPTSDFLDEVIYAHQCTIPFENLDVFERGISPSLGKVDLFEKIVIGKRGGYCFEMNGLFYSLLVELGFDVHAVMSRVTLRGLPNPLISHRANIVHIGTHNYIADVGFGGPMPGFALLMEDGYVRTGYDQTFSLARRGENWWDVRYSGASEEEKSVQLIYALPFEEHDFVPLSFFQSQNPDSVFRNTRMANIRTETGARNLRGTTFTVYDSGTRTVTELQTEGEIDAVLESQFGIERSRGK